METHSVQLPAGEQVVTVRLLNPVNFGPAILQRFMAPPVPGLDTFKSSPSLSFLLEHPSGRRLVFDLGIRKDYSNYAPSVAEYIPTTKYNIEVTHNVVEILEEAGIAPSSIEAVIWSHWHWDHIGDPSSFPSTTDLVVGSGFKSAMLPGAPANPKSPIQESDYTGRNLREIRFDGPQCLQIGKLPAFDYFGDGSFYLLDTPGHAIGHMCGLARTTPAGPDTASTFVLLGGDACHYAGILRPSPHLPLPGEIRPHPCSSSSLSSCLCPGSAFAELQRSRGRAPDDALYDMTFGHDIPLAITTLGHLQEFDCHEDVFVIIAHDSTVRDGAPHFPESLNDWKARGLGQTLKWAFLRDLEPYWKAKGLA
ncbi:metallo-beta-lactamase superfamily protein [Microdochium trichocladiopsis]|uniref:Metallo-beta-lactamase superfamily protein n=1 Tax=Microdochium trichocladiopsis TaxID=1682393 RepID=A0A9P9BMG4_9PEZI|nr:metallo-beta-lactamase superfamily protein [Microdochium trichocladiopsis]KAH7029588.1 metallo-beta-lactamase superfamily protein [Microdochium trichocladiopsis]